MAIHFEFTLDRMQLAILGRAAQIAVAHYPLHIPDLPSDPDRVLKVAKMVKEDLEQQELVVGGEGIPALQAALVLFKDHCVSVAVSGIDGTAEHFAILGLTDGRQAMIILRYGNEENLRFWLLSDDFWLEKLASILPTAPAAPGDKELVIRIPATPSSPAMATRRRAEAEYDLAETSAFENLEVRAPLRRTSGPFRDQPLTDSDRLAKLLSGPRHGSGQIFVTNNGRPGRPREADPMGWLDADQGRYLVHSTVDSHGNTTTRYCPAGHTQLVQALRAAVGFVY